MATNFKDYLGGKDVKWWDGVLRTFSRKTSTGGSLSQNKVGHVVDVLEVYGSGTTYTDVALNAAISAIGSNKCVLLLQPGTWTVDAAVTIPATATLKMPHGAKITIGGGVTLTINGAIDAGPYEIFDGTGTLAGSPILQLWDPTWDAATVTDSTTKSYKNITITSNALGACTSTGAITATNFVSNVAIGTQPLTVTSTTKCTNLNADTVDGYHASAEPLQNAIPVGTGASGQLPWGWRPSYRGALVYGPNAATTGTNITWANESYDTDSLHSAAGSRMTVPAGVSYVRFSWMLKEGAGAQLFVKLRKGGSSVGPYGVTYSTAAPGANERFYGMSGVLSVAAGDYFELYVESGTVSNLDVAGTGSWFCMEVLG